MLKIETVEETVYLEVNALESYARKEYVDDAIDSVNSSISNIESDVSTINSELEKKADKSDLEGLATERYVDEKINNIPEVDLTPYATTESVNEKLKLKADVSDLDSLATKEELGEKADISYVDDKIAEIEIPSIDGLATEEYVDNKVGSIDLSEYATEQYVDSEISKIYVPSLDGYATEEYVDNKVSSIDLSEYALTSDLSSAVESINSDLDIKADKTELEGLATEDYVNEKIDEKEIGITEPELISKSTGSGKWLREGSSKEDFLKNRGVYHASSNLPPKLKRGMSGVGQGLLFKENNLGLEILSEKFTYSFLYYEVQGAYGTDLDDVLTMQDMRGSTLITATRRNEDVSWTNVSWYNNSNNTFPDSNGVLHNSRNPIDTLNTSDMADTVVDNDLLTVTSGAVYRAITKPQNKIDELEGQVNELKALYEQ